MSARTTADRLAALRAERGLTHEDMARLVGVGTSTWRAWEAGDRVPSELTLLGISVRLGVSPGRLGVYRKSAKSMPRDP